MSRARDRADGDFGDLDVTNIGAVSLDSIKGDADGNTSLAFSGSDVITITTGGTTAATFNASQILTLSDDLIIKNSGTIGAANDTDLLTLGNGTLTVAGEVVGTGFTGTLDGILGSGTAAAATTTTLASTTITASGIIKTDDATEATSTTDGSLQTDGGLSVVKDAVFGDDVKLLSDSAVLSFGADSDTTLTHTDGTGLTLNSTNKLTFGDAATFIHQSSNGVMTIDGEATIDLNASTAVLVSNDLKLNSDAAVLGFGADNDVTLTHVADTALLLNSSRQLQFGDSGTHISQSADGVLDLVSDTEIEINATTIDINGNVEISGTTAQVGVSTSTAKDIFNAGMSIKNGATSAGFVEFFEDSDNGTNKVTVIGPASTSDVTLTLPSSAGTIATTATAADEATALAIALG